MDLKTTDRRVTPRHARRGGSGSSKSFQQTPPAPGSPGPTLELPSACLYRGTVRHRRYSPVEHTFTYPLSLLCIDLDKVSQTFRFPRLWSTRSWSFVRFCRSDYFGDPERPLADCIRELVFERTGRPVNGPVRLLAQVRQLGIVFNPVSIYYCYESDTTSLQAIVAEVTNTPWGERHCYVIGSTESSRVIRHECDKQFHVSPFMPMEMTYRWRLTAPGENASVHLESSRNGNTVFDATLVLQRRPLNVWNVLKSIARFPGASIHVLAAIYWQALRLWWKSVAFIPHPKNQRQSTTSPSADAFRHSAEE